MTNGPLKVAWVSAFPVEWMPDAPEEARQLPKEHATSWMRVLAAELAPRRDVQLHAIALRKGIRRNFVFERRGVTFHVMRTLPMTRLPSLFWTDTWLIRSRLKQIQPRLVHAWGNERGAGLVASRLPYPYVVTIQGLLGWYRQMLKFGLQNNLTCRAEEICLRRSRWATTESTFAKDFLRQNYPALNVEQVEHAPDWLFHRTVREPQSSPIRVLTLGEVSYRKGTDLLLSALDRLRGRLDFHLTVVGHPDDELLATLRSQLSPELFQRVTFKHGLRPEEVGKEMAAATLMVLPTRADTSPNAVKEAAVMGLPVIGTSIGGIPDYVFPGKNGLLVPPGDVDALAKALAEAAAHPQFSRGAVDPATLASVRDYLSPARMAENFLRVYRKVLETTPGAPGH